MVSRCCLHCNHWASDTDIEIESGAKDCNVETFSDGRGELNPVTGLPVGGTGGGVPMPGCFGSSKAVLMAST